MTCIALSGHCRSLAYTEALRFGLTQEIAMALTQKELDAMVCANPDCTADHSELFVHSQCHPKAAVWASYDKETALLNIRCAKCEKHIMSIAVAAGNNHCNLVN